MKNAILIVDDDPVQRRLLEAAVSRLGHEARCVEDGARALEVLLGSAASDVSLVILDLVMPDVDGMMVLAEMRTAGCPHPVIVQTAHGGIDTVVGAMRAGASDFVVKPVSPERLEVSINNALKVNALEGEIQRIKKSRSGLLTFKDIVTGSPLMDKVIRLGERAAKSNIPILIEGESGVGKELVARAIQGTGSRKSKPFVTVNCGAIPENLVESILFGHEKGAFTGAVDKHVGKFQEAHGGTLFLDEVGELPPEVQVKLLRAIQEGEIDPVGAKKPSRVDFRLISATNRSMLDLVKEGGFREDLFYRLNVFPIWIPPLRDRPEDIPELARHFMARFAAEEGKRQVTAIAPAATRLLQTYHWPGNIRQLENAVFRAVVLCDGAYLTVEEFPQITAQMEADTEDRGGLVSVSARPQVEQADRQSAAREPVVSTSPNSGSIQSEVPIMAGVAIPDASDQTIQAGEINSPSALIPFGTLPIMGEDGHLRDLEDMEAEMIRIAIDHYGGRMSEVARRLKIGRSTLYRKLKEYGLEDSDPPVAAE
ncbi:MAG: sigma-54 dependent transcriptional regulator [Pseudomonadota bacterium]